MTMLSGTFRALQALAVAGSLLLALTQAGCEKKRALRFSQGSGDNLYDIKQYDGKSFKVTTGEKRFKGQTSRADELLTLNGFNKINNLDAVKFEIQDGLFAGVNIADFNFYGRENFEYTLKYSFTDHYVILSKVAAKIDLPSQELTFATSIGNDQFEVPLMGLPIELFTVEKVKDERGKATRKIETFPRDFLSQSTHFKSKAGSLKYFEAPAKLDLFTADFFNSTDEWFFTKTLVGRSIGSESILGSTTASLKIKFAKTNNSLIGVDLNIAKEQQVLDPTKTITALEIPVQWVDFSTNSSGENARLKENTLGDEAGTSRFWKERKYALVDFNNADRLDKAFTLDNKLEKLEVSDDYLSFTIYESKSGDTYKYSIAKSNRKIEGQSLFSDDAKMFHYFTQRRTVIHGALQNQDQDIDKIVYQSRFYPENGEIVYHISKNSPTDPEFTEAVAASIKSWDDAFRIAGTGTRVRLADERVDVGDVRYNTIVLYGYEIDSGRLLGFGPSVQDTRTGETFSAATHIYLRAYREGLINSIRNYIRSELGLFDDKPVIALPSFETSDKFLMAGGLVNSPIPNLSGMVSLKNFLRDNKMFDAEVGTQFQYEVFGSNEMLKSVNDFETASKKEGRSKLSLVQTVNGPKCDFAAVASVANSWEKIRKVCTGGTQKLGSYLNQLKALHSADARVLTTEGEEEAILDCAQPLMKDLLTSTLIHEVGHNFGLGHNFAATSDSPENHAKNDDGSIAFPSSSVMDYPDRDFDLYNKAGPYDVAAIRFLYARSVETKDKQFIQVPRNLSMFAAAQKLGKTLKPYKMCTDYELGQEDNLPNFDPMCSRWDVGSTPDQYVKWAISQIHADIIQNGYRYNNKGFRGAYRSLNYLDNFKQIQEYFRFLVKGKAGIYLEKLRGETDEEKKLALEKIIAETPESDRALVQSYYAAVNAIYRFGVEVMNLPSRVCVVQNSAGEVIDALEFVPLRQRIFEAEQITVQTCGQAVAHAAKALTVLRKPYAAEANLKFSDRSIELQGLELDLDPAAAANQWKQISFATFDADLDPRFSSGTEALKSKMIQTLTSRASILQIAANAGVRSSNFLDYPWFANELYSKAWSSILDGTDGSLIDPVLLKDTVFQHYQETPALLSGYLSALFMGGLNTQSQGFKYARSMLPNKEVSLANFTEGLGSGEGPVWFTVNTLNEVLYADSGIASEILKLFVKMDQLYPSYLTQLAFTDAPGDLEKKVSKAALASLKTSLESLEATLSQEDKLMATTIGFMEAQGLSGIQPAQRGIIRALIKAALVENVAGVNADGSAKVVKADEELALAVLATFISEEQLDGRLVKLFSEDRNNFNALYRTINYFISNF